MTLDVSSVSFWAGRAALRLAVAGRTNTQEIASLLVEEARDVKDYSRDDEPIHTALEVAVSAGHLDAMERLLEAGTRPRAVDNDWGILALVAAAAQGHLVAVQRLLENGIPPDRGSRSAGAWVITPLMAATEAGHLEICELLLRAGANVLEGVSTPTSGSSSAIKTAVETWNMSLLELLLGAVPDARAATWHDPALFGTVMCVALVASASIGNTLALQRLLDADAAVLDNAHVAIAAAAGGGHLEAMDMLLQTASEQNNLPEDIIAWALESAVQRTENTFILQRLLDVGVDVDIHVTVRIVAAGGHVEFMNNLLQTASDQNILSAHSITRALQSAVDAGSIGMMELLLQAGADPTKISIRTAAFRGHWDALVSILQSGGSAEPTLCPDDDGHVGTPLQWAAAKGHLAVVDLLLARGANVNAPAPESCDMGGTAVQLASAGGHTAVTERLLGAGADVNAPYSEYAGAALRAAALELLLTAGNLGSTAGGFDDRGWKGALSAAAEMNKSEVVTRLLSMMPPNDVHEGVFVALRNAVENHHTALVRQLLEFHPDVDDYEPSSYMERLTTMLQVAAENDDLEILQMLIAGNAHVNLNPSEGFRQTALQSASEHGSLEAVELLLNAGAEVNVTGSTAPPLLLAIRHGHKQVSERLLRAGADIYASSYRGQTMLQAAQDSEDAEMEELVRAALDSQPQPQPDQQPLDRGRGPLCDACRTASLVLFRAVRNWPGFDSAPSLHPSLTALRASACAGCPFCCFVWKQLGITSIALPQPSPVRIFQESDHGLGDLTCEVREPFPRNEYSPESLQFDFHYAVIQQPSQGEMLPDMTLPQASHKRNARRAN